MGARRDSGCGGREIYFEEEERLVVEHEGQIRNFEASVREPIVAMADVEVKETVRCGVGREHIAGHGGRSCLAVSKQKLNNGLTQQQEFLPLSLC